MISLKVAAFLAASSGWFLANGALGAQEAEKTGAAAPFSAELKSLAAAAESNSPHDSGITVKEKLIDRGGPVAFLGAVNMSDRNGKFLPGALICTHHAGQEEEDWLFAAPLWQGTESNTIVPGANLFSLLIQEYRLEDPESSVARQHFFLHPRNDREQDIGVHGQSEESG